MSTLNGPIERVDVSFIQHSIGTTPYGKGAAMTEQVQSQRTPFARTIGGLLTVAVALFTGLPAASASAGCPALSISFEDVKLMNNGVDFSAGPYAIDLPAGVYDVTMISWDAHDTHNQPEQENEQWYFTTDSGYTSGNTVDIPLEVNDATTVLVDQNIGASNEITLHHPRIEGVNSVEPACIGFASTAIEPEVADEVVVPVEPEVVDEVVVPVEPEVVDEVVSAEVKGIVEVAPDTGLVPSASMDRQPAVIPQLAITGPSSSNILAMFSITLILLGSGFLQLSRRRAVA